MKRLLFTLVFGLAFLVAQPASAVVFPGLGTFKLPGNASNKLNDCHWQWHQSDAVHFCSLIHLEFKQGKNRWCRVTADCKWTGGSLSSTPPKPDQGRLNRTSRHVPHWSQDDKHGILRTASERGNRFNYYYTIVRAYRSLPLARMSEAKWCNGTWPEKGLIWGTGRCKNFIWP